MVDLSFPKSILLDYCCATQLPIMKTTWPISIEFKNVSKSKGLIEFLFVSFTACFRLWVVDLFCRLLYE